MPKTQEGRAKYGRRVYAPFYGLVYRFPGAEGTRLSQHLLQSAPLLDIPPRQELYAVIWYIMKEL